MKKRKSLTIKTTLAQRAALARLRILLAEQGYGIFPLTYRLKRHKLDFAAVLKDPPMNFLLVRPTEHGRVSLIPFGPRSQYLYAQRAVTYAQNDSGVIIAWSGRQLYKPKDRDWWKVYFPSSSQYEIRLILGLT